MSHRVLGLLGLLLFTLVPHGGLRGVSPAPSPSVPTPRLLFIGDSLTGGYYASTAAASYAELVTAALHGERLDGGNRYGWTLRHSADVMAVYPPPRADVVVLELGTNDSPDTVQTLGAVYGYVLGLIRHTSPHAHLICLGPWRDTSYAGIDQIERVECGAAGGRFVDLIPLYYDWSFHGPLGRSTWKGAGDWFHPNDLGHAAIARAVLAALR